MSTTSASSSPIIAEVPPHAPKTAAGPANQYKTLSGFEGREEELGLAAFDRTGRAGGRSPAGELSGDATFGARFAPEEREGGGVVSAGVGTPGLDLRIGLVLGGREESFEHRGVVPEDHGPSDKVVAAEVSEALVADEVGRAGPFE